MTVRAIAVGIPERLNDHVDAVPGVVRVPDLVTAAGVLADWPDAHVLYGEHLFGPAVTGQPVFLLDGQGDDWQERVWVLIDIAPPELGELPFDDPRILAAQAAIRLKASRLVDVSTEGAWQTLDALLGRQVDTPRLGGHTEDDATGND